MSMLSNIGAQTAAEEILAAVNHQLEFAKSEEVKEVLRKLKLKCEQIIEAANSGWY